MHMRTAKRRSSPLMIVGLVLAIIMVAGWALLTRDYAAPQVPVVKELDANAFLTPKQ